MLRPTILVCLKSTAQCDFTIVLELIRIGQIGNSMWKYTEGEVKQQNMGTWVSLEAPEDVGLGVGRGLQSTVNDAEAHHLDNGPQHGVLALK